MRPILITVESPIEETPRVQQVRGLFDLPPASHSRLSWEVALPLHERPWHIGLIVGPSGCGKSTIARTLWPDATASLRGTDLAADRSLLDAFPEELSIKDVTALLSAVGFSSPPAWLRPFHVLSTGQQFRVSSGPPAGRAGAAGRRATSSPRVVDRTVAQIGSAALAKTVRARGRQFVAVTCHDDVEDWLQPDWIYQPARASFQWRSSSTTPRHRPPGLSLPCIGVAAIRTASLSDKSLEPLGGLLPGDVARSAGRVLARGCRSSAPGRRPARTSHRHAARLSGRRHRQRRVGADRVAVERPGLPRRQHDDASGDDPRPAGVAAVANAAGAVARGRPRGTACGTPRRG